MNFSPFARRAIALSQCLALAVALAFPAPARASVGQMQVNVQMYGAYGDYNPVTGTGHDDTTAFQAAIASVATNGGIVTVPAASYLLSSTLNIGQSYLKGGGWGTNTSAPKTRLFFRNLQTNPAIQILPLATASTVGLEAMEVFCDPYSTTQQWNATTGCTGVGIDLGGKATIINCHVSRFKGAQIFAHGNAASTSGPYYARIQDCMFDWGGSHGAVNGTGANAVQWINDQFFYNGNTTFPPMSGPTPPVAGSYDGFYLDLNNAGNVVLGTGTLANGSNQVTSVSPTSAFSNGMYVCSSLLPVGTTITSGGGTATLTLSANATGSATGTNLYQYSLYTPDGVEVRGGDSSYNSRYGWNFVNGVAEKLEPAYAEGNLQAAPGQVHFGSGMQNTVCIVGAVQGGTAGIFQDNTFTAYNRNNALWFGGQYLGGGFNSTSFLQAPMTNYVVDDGATGAVTTYATNTANSGIWNIFCNGQSGVTLTSDGGNHFRADTAGNFSFDSTLYLNGPGAIIAAGTASKAPLVLNPGTNLTTPVSGAIENDGASMYYTDNGPTRHTFANRDQNQTFTGVETFGNAIAVNGNAGLPASTGGTMYMAGGYASPVSGRLFVGDGTGYQLNLAKRTGSTTTDLASFYDNGNASFTGNGTFTGGALALNNGTSNWIDFGQTLGMGAPTFNSHSAGTKLILQNVETSSLVDGAIGWENNFLWFSTLDATSARGFKWYGGQTLLLKMTGDGILTHTSTDLMAAGTTTAAPLKLQSGANLTTPQNGAIEYDGTSLYATLTGAIRQTFAFLGVAQTWTAAQTFSAAITPTGGVAAAGGFSVSPRLMHSGGKPAASSSDGTDTAITTTQTQVCEVFVPANTTINGESVLNGSAVAGNLIVALYNSSGTLVANSATAGTAQAGTNAYQRIPFTSTYNAVGPATYYLGIQGNNAAGKIRLHAFGDFGCYSQTGQTFGTLTSITAPTTFAANTGPIASLY